MLLKYIIISIITWALYNLVVSEVFNRNNLVYICCVCFIYAFNIINLCKHNMLAISSMALALIMVFDRSCYFSHDAISVRNFHRCIEYDAVRILAAYSWALGGLIAIVIYGLLRIGQQTKQTNNINKYQTLYPDQHLIQKTSNNEIPLRDLLNMSIADPSLMEKQFNN